ncbi:hypothetical protein H632_c281p1, partial [Helicosporidium sp. ATCC 50920]
MEPSPPFYLSLAGSPEPARTSRLAFAFPVVESPEDFLPLEDAEEAAAELVENLQVRTPDQGLRAVVCGETTLAALSVTLGSAALDVPHELRDAWQSAIWINGLWPSSFSLLSCSEAAACPGQAAECSQDSASKESVEDYICAPEEVQVREALALLDGQGAVRPWTAQADPRTPAGVARRASKRPRESSQPPVGGPSGSAAPNDPPHPCPFSSDRLSGSAARRALPIERLGSSPRGRDAALASACAGGTALEKALAEAAPLQEPGEGSSPGQSRGAARLAADGGALFQAEGTTASSFDLPRTASSSDLNRAASLPRRLRTTARRRRRPWRCVSAPPDLFAEGSGAATTQPAPDVLPASVETEPELGAAAGRLLPEPSEARRRDREFETASIVAPARIQRAKTPTDRVPRPFRAAWSAGPLVLAPSGDGQARPCRLLAGLTFLVTCVRDASWRAAVEKESQRVTTPGGRDLLWKPGSPELPRPLLRKVVDGAQSVGMGAELAARSPAARAVFERASDVLGYDVLELCTRGPAERLNSTTYSQPAIYTCSLAGLAAMEEEPSGRAALAEVDAVAGLSLGEYTALTYAEAWSFETGLRLVAARGEAMQAASERAPTGMLSVVGLDRAGVEKLAEEANELISDPGQHVALANLLCPG